MSETRKPLYISELTPTVVGLILSLGLAVGLTVISDSVASSWAGLVQSGIYTCVFLSGALSLALLNRLGERMAPLFTVPARAVPSGGPVPGDSPLPAKNPSLRHEQQGLHQKFIVRRADGSDNPGGKHFGCRHFVLDVDHDPYAIPALSAYARACQATHPFLAEDLRNHWGAEPDPEPPLRYSHWAFQNPHYAEHYWHEARACREELGFDPNSDDITPAQLKEAIRSLGDNDLTVVAERVCRHLPEDRVASLHFERGAAWVELEDLDGKGQQLPDPADKSLRDQLNDALVAANGWTALPGNQEDREP